MDFSTIVHYITVASPYVCGFWAFFFMFLNWKTNKTYLLERDKIRNVLHDKFDIDLESDVFTEFNKQK